MKEIKLKFILNDKNNNLNKKKINIDNKVIKKKINNNLNNNFNDYLNNNYNDILWLTGC